MHPLQQFPLQNEIITAGQPDVKAHTLPRHIGSVPNAQTAAGHDFKKIIIPFCLLGLIKQEFLDLIHAQYMHPYYWVQTYFLLVFKKILVHFFTIDKGKMLFLRYDQLIT